MVEAANEEAFESSEGRESKLAEIGSTIGIVLSFLRGVGLDKAEAALLNELGERFPELGATSEDLEEGDEGSITDQAVHESDLEPSQEPERTVTLSEPVQRLDVKQENKSSRKSGLSPRSSFSRQTAPAWGSEIDEYENMDDVGYTRRSIVSQSNFMELELDLAKEEGNEGYFVHNARQPGIDSGFESLSDDCDENGADRASHTSSARVSEEPRVSAGGPPPPTQMPASMLANLANNLSSRDVGGPFSATSGGLDEAWDQGPTDIKLADPVIIAGKSVDDGMRSGDEARPVLSRVESLSSSFMDFELERLDDEQFMNSGGGGGGSGGRCGSGQLSDTGDHQQNADSVVEFSPPGTGGTAVDLEMFTAFTVTRSGSHTLSQHSRSSSTGRAGMVLGGSDMGLSDRGSPSQGGGTSEALSSSETTQILLSSPSPLLSFSLSNRRQNDTKEIGGFSFPVTPSSGDGLHKTYKSWPSVKSNNSTSEPLDDVSGTPTADYLDEGYESKLSSRAPSRPDPAVYGSRTSPGSPECSPVFRRQHTCSDSGLSLPPAATTDREPSLMLPPHKDVSEPMSSSPDPGSEVTNGGEALLPKEEVPVEKEEESSLEAATTRKPADSAVVLSDALVEDAESQNVPGSSSGGGSPVAVPSPLSEKKDVLAHQIRISSDDLTRSSISPGGGTPEMSGASGEDSGGDGDSASLVGDSYDVDGDDDGPAIEWQEIRGATEGDEDDMLGQEELLEEDGKAPMSPTASEIPDQQDMPRFTIDETGAMTYHYDPEYIKRKYQVFNLQVIHRSHRTGFEETKDFPIRMNDLIAGRYQVMDFLGAAAFSRAVQALDIKTNTLVCLKIVKNNKDYFDQSLDEIKLLKYVNSADPDDEQGVVRLYDYFYYKEHLFLVCELLRANLYEFQKYNKESGEDLYFTNARIQKIAISVLKSLAFLHSLDLIHSDLKPENILVKSYSRCEVKVIDLGSSCFITDQLSSYVQSRSYRAPEVILGLPYDHKVDIWSLGCILAELSSGYVLFQNDSVATLLARLEGVLGPVPDWMVRRGRYSHRFYTKTGHLYERVAAPVRTSGGGSSPSGSGATGGGELFELLVPKKTSMRHRIPDAAPGLLDLIGCLLCVDPRKRPSAAEALRHPWLQQAYPSLDSM